MKRYCFTALSALFFSVSVFPLSPPPPLPEADLIAFYEALDGDNWVRNDGWLDDDTPICDWYGISCQNNPTWGYLEIGKLELPNNGLDGEFRGAVRQMLTRVQVRADLSGNDISGPFVHFPAGPAIIDLSHNQLEGQLPEGPGGVQVPTPPPLPPGAPADSRKLNLSGNQLSGAIPASWGNLALAELDLSDNQLDGGAKYAFAAMREGAPGYLNLAGNRFAETLDDSITTANLYFTDVPLAGGGLNLCFNEFDVEHEVMAEWIDLRHVAGPGWQQCQHRPREQIDATVSGSWYAPTRAGEGIALQLLDDERALVYHFSFDLDGHQSWSFEVGRAAELHMDWPQLLETRGDFNQGLRYDAQEQPLMRSLGRLRLDRVDDDRLHAERVLIDWTGCPPLQQVPEPGGPVPMPCPIFPYSDRQELFRLSRLAGSSCDNQHEHQGLSGAWFSPERSGEGFLVEVMADGSAVVYWFTYLPDDSGQQAWMIGQGPVNNMPPSGMPMIGIDPQVRQLINIDQLLMPVGGRPGAEFDPGAIEYLDWGQLRLEFYDLDQGRVIWTSELDEFDAGEYSLERLARPMLAECPED